MDEVSVRRVRLLANGTNRKLIVALEGGPSFPRELALRIGVSEDHAQRRLRELQSAGLVSGRWSHPGKTVKLYELSVKDFVVTLRPDEERVPRGDTD